MVLISPFVRDQLRVFVFSAVVAAGVFAATSDRGRTTVGAWSRGERFRALVVAGLVIAFDVVLIHHAYEWYIGTHYGHKMFTYGLWAVGALGMGLGVLPLLFALAWAFGAPIETREDRALLGMFVGLTTVSSSTPRSRRHSWQRRSPPGSRNETDLPQSDHLRHRRALAHGRRCGPSRSPSLRASSAI